VKLVQFQVLHESDNGGAGAWPAERQREVSTAFETMNTSNKLMVDGHSKTILSRGRKVRADRSGAEVWHVTLLNGVHVDYLVRFEGGDARKWFLYRRPFAGELATVAA